MKNTCKNGKEATQYPTDHKEVVKSVLTYPQLFTIENDILNHINEKLNHTSAPRRKLLALGPASKDAGPEPQPSHQLVKQPAQQSPQPCLKQSEYEPMTDDTANETLNGEVDVASVYFSETAHDHCIECSRCHEWTHWSCEKLTEKVFQDHTANPDSEYICMLYKHEESKDSLADRLMMRNPPRWIHLLKD